MKLKDTIGIFPQAFSQKECEDIKNYFEGKITNNEAIQGYSSSGLNGETKLTTDYNIMSYDTAENNTFKDLIINKFNTNLDRYLTNYPNGDSFDSNSIVGGKTFYPALNLQKYDANKGHYNTWHCENDHFAVSQRQFVFILYLNDVKEGGETEFLFKEKNQGDFFNIKPETGKLIIHPASWPYVHRGAIPKSNDKYIVTTWLQFGDW